MGEIRFVRRTKERSALGSLMEMSSPSSQRRFVRVTRAVEGTVEPAIIENLQVAQLRMVAVILGDDPHQPIQ